jgi:AcrR family transcriptional regulator
MRRDAVRNQRSVLEAARAVLSESGTDASMELIAVRAGVGVGTVYRHFPNKGALIDALVRAIYEELISAARIALDRGDGTGLAEFLRTLGASFAEHRGYARMLVGHTPLDCGAELLRKLIAQLLEQGKAAAKINAQITLGDIMTTIWGLRGIVETSGEVAPRAWERHLDIHLTALQAESITTGRPSLTAGQLTRISSSARASS